MRKTNKAALLNHIKQSDAVAEESTTIIDGGSLLHRVNARDAQQTTFSLLAEQVWALAKTEGAYSRQIHIVFDVYKDLSIKTDERRNRGDDRSVTVTNITAGTKCKQYRKFLASSVNKSKFIQFLVVEWASPKYLSKLARQQKVLYVTCGEEAHRFSSNDCTSVPELRCSQEEADGRMLFHAIYAARQGSDSVLISSDDTDVFVLCLAMSPQIETKLFLKTITRTRCQLLDMTETTKVLGADVCEALLGLHAFMGCYAVSAFAGKGKISAFKLMRQTTSAVDTFRQLGKTWALPTELFEQLELFACALYASKHPSNDVDELRYNLFCVKQGDIESHQLPPCKDC